MIGDRPAVPTDPPMFTDISDRILGNPPTSHYGIAVSDLDGDGLFEVFVCGHAGPNRLFKWADGRLRDVAPPRLADARRQALAAAAGDVDGDGREELYVLNSDTFAGPKQYADRLFAARPDGWVDLFRQPGNHDVRNLMAGRSVVAIDRRGTGRYAFFVANYGRPSRLYEYGPDGRLWDLAPGLGLAATTGGRGLWAGPIVSPRMDLVCVNEHGPNFVYRNEGDGPFTDVAAVYGLLDPGEHGRGVTALDANGDGRLDLCWGNWDGPHRLMVRQPDNTFRDRASPAMGMPGPVRTVIAADFDNDGYEELFFNFLGEPNRLFGRRTTDPAYWSLLDIGAAAEPDGLGTGAAVADLDGDGRLELLIAHGESGEQPLSLFRGPANDNAWLRVLPRTRYGAPARGALVKLTAGGRTQLRVTCAGSGYLCQMEPVAHFGLGPDPHVDAVTVTWPDGASLTLDRPTARQTLVVDCPNG